MARRIAYRLLIIALAVGFLYTLRWYWGVAWQRITVSRDTTRIAGPLRTDGTVDYLAAINLHYQQGVTHENNAAIPLLLLSDDDVFWPEIGTLVAPVLGAPELAQPRSSSHHYFTFEHARRISSVVPSAVDDSEFVAEEQQLGREPWKAVDHLDAAAWLARNRPVLQEIEQAIRRPRYFLPMFKPGERAIFAQIPLLPAGLNRPYERAFAARAMMNIGSGDLAAAHRDAMNVFLLGLCMGQQPTLMERIVSLGMINRGLELEARILAAGPAPELAAQMQNDLAKIVRLPSLVEPLDIHERLGSLDNVVLFARFGPDGPGETIPPTPAVPAGSFSFGIWPLHFDPVMREANQRWDRLVEVIGEENTTIRETQTLELVKEGRAYQMSLTGQVSALNRIAAPRIPEFISAMRSRDNTRQQLILTQAALDAVIHIPRSSGEEILRAAEAAWERSVPPNIFTGKPIRIAFKPPVITLNCEAPPPLALSEEIKAIWGDHPPHRDFQLVVLVR